MSGDHPEEFLLGDLYQNDCTLAQTIVFEHNNQILPVVMPQAKLLATLDDEDIDHIAQRVVELLKNTP